MATNTTTTVPVTFTYRSQTAESVQVSGDWDSWSQRVDLEKIPHSVDGSTDLWQATKQVPASSKFHYKYIVNENDWHVREDLPTEADHSGNRNNVLESPEAEHAATDSDNAEKTTAEIVGAGVVASVGAAIASVVGTDPFETSKTPVATEPGLTANGDKQLNEAEKESALLNAGQGEPAGAAAVSKDGLVPTEQLSKLGLSEGKTPADAGAAAIAGAAAAVTGAVAAGQSTGKGAISPKSLDTVKASEPSTSAAAASSSPAATSATSPTPGTLDQTAATKGLGDAAAGDGPTIGAPTTIASEEKAAPVATGAATAAAAATAIPVGAAAVAPSAVESKKEAAVAPSAETKQHNEAIAAPAAEKENKEVPASSKTSKAEKGGIAALVATAAAATAAVVTQPKETAETVEEKLQQKEPAKEAAAEPAANGATKKKEEDVAAAGVAAAGTAGAAEEVKKTKKKSSKTKVSKVEPAPVQESKAKSETAAKQEQLSSGPTAKSTTAASATPIAARYERTSPTSETAPTDASSLDKRSSRKINGKSGTTAASIAAVTAGGSAAAAASSKPSSAPSETVQKQEAISSGPIAASAGNKTAAAPALEGQTGAPSTPSKSGTFGRKSGASSRFGSKRNKEQPPLPGSSTTNGPSGASDYGVLSSSSAADATANKNQSQNADLGPDSPARHPSTPKKTLSQGSRKKSFFGRIREKLSGSPSK